MTPRLPARSPSASRLVLFTAVVAAMGLLSATAYGQIFVTNDSGANTVSEYTLSGTSMNPTLITGLGNPLAIAVSGSDLYITNYSGNTVGEYTLSGTPVNASLI